MKKKICKIAVVGLSGVFPGAKDTRQFLDNIIHKKSAVITVPEDRWVGPVKEFVAPQSSPDRAVSSKAGLIKDFQFDPDNFLVDRDLLSVLDPVHQLVLHAGREAFYQCAHTPEARKRTGVILAAIALPTDTSSQISWQIRCSKTYKGPGPEDFSRAAVVSMPAAVLARAMGFEGSCFTLDAACASSLYAIKLACEHLHLKKADIMIAGGVSRPDSLYTQIGFSQLKALSPSGRCSPFDKDADGLVVGEGTGMVVLKRLEDAINAGDTIHAVITGAGVSNDIDGTLVGPAREGQVRAMAQAYRQALWSPLDIQYMECHGSGTPVGDQVELSSIKQLLDTFECPDKVLSIGSVKSMTGHLLTAAGAAGFIKTILSMNNGFLPPSLNFTEPAANSILNKSRISVQTEVADWNPGAGHLTRKAAISAFGFGGINAHLLVEEFKKTSTRHFVTVSEQDHNDEKNTLKKLPCAIVGMETIAKDCLSLSRFKDLIFDGTRQIPELAGSRWKTAESHNFSSRPGFYLGHVSTAPGEFHIPPNQIDDILPQHIMLLKAAKGALEDSGISPRPLENELKRDRIGCAIGIEFDYGATDFHLRWKINHLDEALKNRISPSLTFNRTLGALGGIVASRVAREFKLGGPCFTLSAGAASGIKSIETAVHSLSSYETDTFICGSVDLAGDIRQSLLNDTARPHTDLILPSEGAAAIVLKRLDQAIEDGDKIYAVVTGIAGAAGGSIPGEAEPDLEKLETLYTRSLETALNTSKTSLKDLQLYEACTTGVTLDDTTEINVLNRLYRNHQDLCPCHVTSTSSVIGNTRGASSLFSVIKTALCLNSRLLPPNRNELQAFEQLDKDLFLFNDKVVHWKRQNDETPRKACIASITMDGCCAHVILEENTPQDTRREAAQSNAALIDPVPIEPDLIARGSSATASAHEKFLDVSIKNMQELEKQFKTLTHLAGNIIQTADDDPASVMEDPDPVSLTKAPPPVKPFFLGRKLCLEFATGKAGNVLGKAFEIIDTYPVRVRLPDEPLMLVDRIMDIQGEILSLTSGKIITQHDVKKEAWYLDGGKAPVSISIEAGQADLFLCSFLGVDHVARGLRKYRLLDARVTFHRTLPEPEETIEYHIEIDRFLKQGDVILFFFHYRGYINDQLLISMRDGCAGFFTEQEVENSGGIILKTEDLKPIHPDSQFYPLVPVEKEAFSDEKIEALRQGDLGKAFGENFKHFQLGSRQKLPNGRMHLIDRVLSFDPSGGRYHLGSIIAEADIHPDDWFLICHFIDDPVMPGTLMYECCAHALRIFIQRMGWVSDREDVFYDVLLDNESDLKCRGPVTPETKKARYEIEVKEMGYNPEPYVIADAHMFSDDLRIVLYKNMGMKITGLTKNDLNLFWRKK